MTGFSVTPRSDARGAVRRRFAIDIEGSPPLLTAEAQYKYNQEKNSPGLAGDIKLGVWYHFGKLNDQRRGTDGLSLANPLSNGSPLSYRGDYGVYGPIDKMIWRYPGDDPNKGLGVFALASAAPRDRNLANFYAEAGITLFGIGDSRPNDTFGLAAIYSPVSPSVSSLDADTAFFEKTPLPIRDYELAVELTYQPKIMPGFYIQPDFQYIFHPGYGVVDPVNPAVGRIRDAAVFGLRTLVIEHWRNRLQCGSNVSTTVEVPVNSRPPSSFPPRSRD